MKTKLLTPAMYLFLIPIKQLVICILDDFTSLFDLYLAINNILLIGNTYHSEPIKWYKRLSPFKGYPILYQVKTRVNIKTNN